MQFLLSQRIEVDERRTKTSPERRRTAYGRVPWGEKTPSLWALSDHVIVRFRTVLRHSVGSLQILRTVMYIAFFTALRSTIPHIMEAGFTSDEWKTMSTQELVRRCRDLCAQARALAVTGRPEDKDAHLRVASEWLKLAEEIQQHWDEERDSRRERADS